MHCSWLGRGHCELDRCHVCRSQVSGLVSKIKEKGGLLPTARRVLPRAHHPGSGFRGKGLGFRV